MEAGNLSRQLELRMLMEAAGWGGEMLCLRGNGIELEESMGVDSETGEAVLAGAGGFACFAVPC